MTGVYDLPGNTHFPFHILGSYSTMWVMARFGPVDPDNWGGGSLGRSYIYVKFRTSYPPPDFSPRLMAAVEGHRPEVHADWVKQDMFPHLQPVADIHLHSHYQLELATNGRASYVYMLAAIGLFVLVIASVNYVNMATARSSGRVKEIGMRRAIGAHRGQLVGQFVCESAVQVGLAAVLAAALTWQILPAYAVQAGRDLAVGAGSVRDVVWLLVGCIAISLLGAVYPVLVLARFETARVFKTASRTGSYGVALRRVLVQFQFALSILLVLATAIVFQQFRFLQTKDIGFERKDVIWVRVGGKPGVMEYGNQIAERVRALPSVVGVARYQSRPFERMLAHYASDYDIRIADSGKGEGIKMPIIPIDGHVVPVLNMELVAGRNVATGLGPKQREFLVNESAVTALGFKEVRDIVGRTIEAGWYGVAEVVGVVGDFHWDSLHHAVGPTVLTSPRWVTLPGETKRQHYYSNLAIRFLPGRVSEGLAEVKGVWREYTSHYPFTYQFLDDIFQRQYQNEANLAQLLAGFSCLAVFVASLGVFALSAFTVRQRTKEIGVRKVVGATTRSILVLLGRDFGRQFLVGALVAWPVAYWVMTRWLEGFAYRDDPGLLLFAGATTIVLFAAVVAVSQQLARAAWSNPVDALRYE